MDRVELSSADIERLLEWRDAHKEEVRTCPAPLRAVEIVCPESELRLKCIRDGDNVKFHVVQAGTNFGNIEFVVTEQGDIKIKKDKTSLSRDDIASLVTGYFSLMALMVYGNGAKTESRPVELRTATTYHRKEKPDKKKKKPTVYILRQSGGSVSVLPKGSHASPQGVFTVRGHFRHYKSGKVVWVQSFEKGTGKNKPKTYKLGNTK
jgi:hypothetical protein